MLRNLGQAAKDQAKKAADAAGRVASDAADKAVAVASDPANQAKAKLMARDAARVTAKGAGKAAEGAGRAVKGALDKLNPATLAAIVMKATSIQEQANAVLRNHKSLYRIGGIEIGAAFPPSISFQIVRAAELELEEAALGVLDGTEADALGPVGAEVSSAEIDALIAELEVDDADDAGETSETGETGETDPDDGVATTRG